MIFCSLTSSSQMLLCTRIPRSADLKYGFRALSPELLILEAYGAQEPACLLGTLEIRMQGPFNVS